MSYRKADVKQIAEVLKDAKDNKRSAAVLMGAGMSVSAGIPTAIDIVRYIERKFPNIIRDTEATYPKYMNELSKAQQRDLIHKYIQNAKLNWAHIHLASLINAGFIDRVLTTNFDPLVVRALGALNIYPGVYDFATAASHFKATRVAKPAVFYLHGQHHGFVMLHSEEECAKHYENLGGMFSDTDRDRVWIVIGYSGYNDPVFQRLAELSVYESNLYWVGYKDNPPAEHIQKDILSDENKHGYYVSGHTADSFFRNLATKLLDTHLPPIINTPFSYLLETLNQITPYPIDDKTVDPTEEKKRWITTAIKGFEQGEGFENLVGAKKEQVDKDQLIKASRDVWINDKYDALDDLRKQIENSDISQAKENLAYAYNDWGVDLGKLGEHKEAIEKFKQTIKFKPDYAEAYYNWGLALGKLGKHKEAIEKYEQAIKLKPDYAVAYANILELALIQKDTETFEQTLLACKKECKLEPSHNHIINGLTLLHNIYHNKALGKTLKSFINSANGNIPLKGWDFDELDYFYESSKSTLKPKKLKQTKAVISLLRGEISLAQFKKSFPS